VLESKFENAISDYTDSQPAPGKSRVLDDPLYYKQALAARNHDELNAAQQLHSALSQYVSCKDLKNRGMLAQKLIACYWEFVKCIVPKTVSKEMTKPRQMLLRFGAVLPSLFTEAQKELFSSVIVENTTGEPIYYLDEWLHDIAAGLLEISPNADGKIPRKTPENPAESAAQLAQQKNGTIERLQNIGDKLDVKLYERAQLENELQRMVELFVAHDPIPAFETYLASLTEQQKRLPQDIFNQLKTLLQIDSEIAGFITQYKNAFSVSQKLDEKMEFFSSDNAIHLDAVQEEVNTVFDMTEQTIGSKGNPFPIFTGEFFHCEPQTTGFRENVLDIMAKIEAIDPGVFCRIHKNEQRRIVPYVLLVPSYGDIGVCWEPFSRSNITSSRGRLVIPMYPKNLFITVLTALADLRWQTIKEKASLYWMSEGLTGQYYEWFAKQKIRSDIKDSFIDSYITWITKESNGLHQMDTVLRTIFWKQIPFSEAVIEKLKTKSAVYQNLAQRSS
jgi:hypothetical protein